MLVVYFCEDAHTISVDSANFFYLYCFIYFAKKYYLESTTTFILVI